MNRHSVFFKLNLFFILALLMLMALYGFVKFNEQLYADGQLKQRAMELGRLLHLSRTMSAEERLQMLNEADFLRIETLPKTASELRSPGSAFRPHAKHRPRLRIFRDGSNTYYRVNAPFAAVTVEELRTAQPLRYANLLFALLLGGIITLYLMLRQSLQPLQKLSEQIRAFARGANNIDTRSNRKDEIALISNEFHDAASQIRQLEASRKLFLHNVMHELKTPLTKGKLLLALFEPSKHTTQLNGLFDRMDGLINQMANIEKLQSTKLSRRPCSLAALTDKAVAQLYVEKPEEKIMRQLPPKEVTLNADEALLVSALANLIDNALKYADALPITLIITETSLCIINHGKPLEKAFETYLEAFVGDKHHGGFGLGLSIAKTIIDAHGFELSYRYEAASHHVCIGFTPSATEQPACETRPS